MSTVLNPVIPVNIQGEVVEVRELTWKDYLAVIKRVTGTALSVVGPGGKLDLNAANLTDAITEQEDTLQLVLSKSTGKDQEWVAKLSARDACRLLDAAVALNLSEEVLAEGKKLAGKMAGVFGLKKVGLKPSSPEPLTTSSPPATPSQT